MNHKVTVAELAEHIAEEKMICACGWASFDIPSENGEAMLINLHAHVGDKDTVIGPFTSITCRHCGEVMFLYIPALKRTKDLREAWKLRSTRKHPDSRTEQSGAEGAADSSAGDPTGGLR